MGDSKSRSGSAGTPALDTASLLVAAMRTRAFDSVLPYFGSPLLPSLPSVQISFAYFCPS